MLVLPNTPHPISTPLAVSALNNARAPLLQPLNNYNECVRYTTILEEYLVQLISLEESQVLTTKVPWTNVRVNGKKIEWTVFDEKQTVAYSMALVYIRIGSDMANELIDKDTDQDHDAQWRSVGDVYKRAISFAKYGGKVGENNPNNDSLSSFADSSYNFGLVEKAAEIASQMTILAKFSWINRSSLIQYNDVAQNTNNGTLARVAIYAVTELQVVANMLDNNECASKQANTSAWKQYLAVMTRYAAAYAGMFLSIEYYQQEKLGQALGLVRFALVKLQSKYTEKKGKERIRGIRDKFVAKRNESLLRSFSAVSSLNLDKSIFGDVVLNDLSYLFDMCVQLKVKYEKENGVLAFEEVADWKEIESDVKWPTGVRVPTGEVKIWKH